MIIYHSTKRGFMEDIDDGNIEHKISQMILEKTKRRSPISEIRSWANSLKNMYIVMRDNSIHDDLNVAIEYKIPNSNKRVDFIVTGIDERKKKNAVIIELKQWQKVDSITHKDGIVKTFIGGGIRENTHPSYQAYSYASMIYDYNENVRNTNILLKPCAFLHNYEIQENDPLLNENYHFYIEKAPVFSKFDTRKLRSFITDNIKEPDKTILEDIEHGVIKPSKSLQDSIAKLLAGNKEFILLDDQKVIFELIKDEVRNLKDDHKKTIIIKGGPGTGKSVLAINLLSEILQMEKNAIYVTKNSAPRNVYLNKLVQGNYKKVEINNLFKGPDNFYNALSSSFDVVLVDEAHRLRQKSGMFQNKGENQIKEIIEASKISVFFIDDHQKVTTKDIGSIEEIKKHAQALNVEIIETELLSQFRCNGSDGYLAWIDNILDIKQTDWDLIDLDYDIRVLDSAEEVRDLIYEKNKINNKARLLAGYCWNWDKKERNNPAHFDIQIKDFKMPWNFENTATWAIDQSSVNQIGCIHTSQGLEFDYVGVIIGDDLRFENNEIVTDFFNRAKTDQSTSGLKKKYKENKYEALEIADTIIRNTYRTLLTRGQKGCYIYCTDKELSNYIKSTLENNLLRK